MKRRRGDSEKERDLKGRKLKRKETNGMLKTVKVKDWGNRRGRRKGRDEIGERDRVGGREEQGFVPSLMNLDSIRF